MNSQTLLMHLSRGGSSIDGDATVAGFEGWIEIETFNWSIVTGTSQDEPTLVKARHKHLNLKKHFDRTSTALYGHMRDQLRLTTAMIVLLDTSRQDCVVEPMVELNIHDCQIESINTSASDGGNSMQLSEDICLSFVTGTLRYYVQDHVGGRRTTRTEFNLPRGPKPR